MDTWVLNVISCGYTIEFVMLKDPPFGDHSYNSILTQKVNSLLQ